RLLRTHPLTSTPLPYTTLFRSRRQPLVAEEHDAILPEGVPDFRQHLVGQWPRQLDPADLGAHMRRQRRHPDVLIGHRYSPDLLQDRKSTRLNSSHRTISYAVFC